MLSEEFCPSSQRFLKTDLRFSDKVIQLWKKETAYINADKNLTFERYLNWQRTENEVAIFIKYAYADLLIPKQFDCIFDDANPDIFIQTKFTITHSVLEALYPTDDIENGHKYLCILNFEDGIPEILNQLKVLDKQFYSESLISMTKNLLLKFQKKTVPSILGICQMKDYQSIAAERRKSNPLN